MSYRDKIRDAASYRERLNRFLTDKCLLFNPYTISDRKLWDGLQKMRWRGEFSLTQMLLLHIENIISEGTELQSREHVVCRLGDSTESFIKEMHDFTMKRPADDSLQQIRCTINGHPIRHSEQIRSLVGKTVFVSRAITTVTRWESYSRALAMHRLNGDLAVDAAIIRTAIINSKLEMLDRLLKYPHAHVYLDGEPDEPVDIETPISKLKAVISSYATIIPTTD